MISYVDTLIGRLLCHRLNALTGLTIVAVITVHVLERALLPVDDISGLCIPGAKPADAPPPQREQAIHALEAATGRLGDEEPGPQAAERGDGREQPEGALGAQAALGDGQEHRGHGARVPVLVHEMETHDHGAGDGADAERVDLGVEEVLDAVPAHGPAEAGQVDHHDGAGGGVLVRGGVFLAFAESGDGGQESGDVGHGEELEPDADAEGPFAADDVDEEEGADEGGDEFDDAKDRGREELFILTAGSEKGEKVRRIDGDGLRARPLGQQLRAQA